MSQLRELLEELSGDSRIELVGGYVPDHTYTGGDYRAEKFGRRGSWKAPGWVVSHLVVVTHPVEPIYDYTVLNELMASMAPSVNTEDSRFAMVGPVGDSERNLRLGQKTLKEDIGNAELTGAISLDLFEREVASKGLRAYGMEVLAHRRELREKLASWTLQRWTDVILYPDRAHLSRAIQRPRRTVSFVLARDELGQVEEVPILFDSSGEDLVQGLLRHLA